MSKQTYQKPNTEIIYIETEEMIATSGPTIGYSNDEVDSNAEALGNEFRGSFGDLWGD